MREKDDTAAEPIERRFVTVRLETPGPRSHGPHGNSRRISRAISDAERAALMARLRAVAEDFLKEIGAIESDDGWVEALADGSWGWRIEK